MSIYSTIRKRTKIFYVITHTSDDCTILIIQDTDSASQNHHIYIPLLELEVKIIFFI